MNEKMTGLTGTRVIVVDDEPDEALPVLKALAKKGVSAAYFTGNLEELPEESSRLSGIRLAILDMDITGSGSDKNKAAALVNVIKKIINPQNGPFAVLVWTKHPEIIELFENYIFLEKDIPNSICTVTLTKDKCKKNGNFNFEIVADKLSEALSETSPLLFLQTWEEKCFKAASEVTNNLSILSENNAEGLEEWRKNWKEQLLMLMRTMAQAQAGKHLTQDNCLDSFYGSLNPLHADRMENKVSDLTAFLIQKSSEIIDSLADVSVEQKAKINTMLHIAFEGTSNFSGGNIYLYKTEEKPEWVPALDDILSDLLPESFKLTEQSYETLKAEGLPENTISQLKKLYNKKDNSGEKGFLKDVEKEIGHDQIIKYKSAILKSALHHKNKQLLSSASQIVLVEINALCDHAQKNISIARFVSGILTPTNHYGNIKKAEFIKRLGPFFFDQSPELISKGEYYLCLSSRHLVTTCRLHEIKNTKPVGRLRSQALTALQAWFAGHASRPGMLIL